MVFGLQRGDRCTQRFVQSGEAQDSKPFLHSTVSISDTLLTMVDGDEVL